MKENKSMRMKNSIQKKLMAATSMLMVAVIMMVSSTYAWFTLSTAPEVTGITTAVGANGNLEIALATTETWNAPEKIGSGVSTSGIFTTWGNLIDVSGTSYGLADIKLMPAALNLSDDGKTVDLSYLSTPGYGADGRVSELLKNTVTGTYREGTTGQFVSNDEYGVRAVGTASAMTERQIAYRNAKSALQTGSNATKSKASGSLANNGNALAEIVIQRAIGSEEEFAVSAKDTILNVLEELGLAIDNAEEAIKGAIIGLYASQRSVDGGIDDTEFELIASAVNSLTAFNVTEGNLAVAGQNLPLTSNLLATIEQYNTILAKYGEAQNKAEAVQEYTKDGDETQKYVTWTDLSKVLTYIVNQENVTINDQSPSEFRDNIGSQVAEVLTKGINVQLGAGSGIYYDIAVLVGNYKTEVTIEGIEAGSFGMVSNIPANMVTNASGTPYFTGTIAEITAAGAPASSGMEANATITDVYGYAIDMFFRTNAANSNLLLRTTPVDRIYSDNTSASDTMGGGSTMTFTLTDNTLPLENMIELMGAIRVVFMEQTETANNVLAYARLDMNKTENTPNYTVVGGNEVTADLLLYSERLETKEPVVTTIEAAKVTADGIKAKDETVKNPDGSSVHTVIVINEDGSATSTVTTTEVIGTYTAKDTKEAVITALGQNTPQKVTVLVYLDGNYVDNSMVAATGTTTMTGTMNLQFASDAELVPMQYTALYDKSAQ